jgi:hypothetical protein
MQLQRSLSDLAIGVNSEAFPTTWAFIITEKSAQFTN